MFPFAEISDSITYQYNSKHFQLLYAADNLKSFILKGDIFRSESYVLVVQA
jgi:hypothetical protein